MKKGKFFVFEGIDGSGKSTQTKLLGDYFIKKGYRVEMMDFPQHGERSSAVLDDYLNGKYGSSESVGPYIGSLFFAIDRYDGSFKIRKWLEEGKIVISDRYSVSNIGHQGGKLIGNKKEWKKYAKWLYNLEYGLFGIPKPDYTFILKTFTELSVQMSNKILDEKKKQKRLFYLKKHTDQDIHEADKKHLRNALKSYLMVAKEFPKDFKVVDCMKNGKMMSPEIINKKIIQLVEKL